MNAIPLCCADPTTRVVPARATARLRLLAAGSLAASALALLGGASTASAVPLSTEFNSSGSTETFEVPAGIQFLSVSAVGGQGARAYTSSGGSGAAVSARLAVQPGQVLYVTVAGDGSGSIGGYNGGGDGGSGGGGGGGASDVRTIPPWGVGSRTSRLIVAAGGGGDNDYGRWGGDAEQPGEDVCGSVGGGAGTQEAGGAGVGTCYGPGSTGSPGSFGLGGAGSSRGGGGGAGWYGGGGGFYATGGGGSNYFGLGTSIPTESLGSGPKIVFTYEPTSVSIAPSLGLDFPTQPLSTVSSSQLVTLTNTGSDPVDVNGDGFGGSNPDDFFVSARTCGARLAAAASCTYRIRFVPGGQGARSASFSPLTTASSTTPGSIALTGTGGSLPTGATGATGATGETGETGDGRRGRRGRHGRHDRHDGRDWPRWHDGHDRHDRRDRPDRPYRPGRRSR